MPKNPLSTSLFTRKLLQWFAHAGRKDLPWQHPRTPYRVWLSEIMLQQTQVKTVIPYFERFIAHFPELTDLANAHEDDVLALWSGLGYYSRARRLHETAKIIEQDYQGLWPRTVELLTSLPGIGRSTAAAIASQAFNQATAILDGNVKRVLCRYFMVEGYPEQQAIKTKLWELAQLCMPATQCADYTQAIMDLGATCCTSRNPQCSICPLQQSCLAYSHNRVPEFPFKPIRKKIPTKEQQFLLIINESQHIYLEKNPPTGLWGSLWCLPSLDMTENPLDYLNQVIPSNHAVTTANQFMNFKHTFSHFHLNIQVILCKIARISTEIISESTGKWFTVQEITQLGIPKPVQIIIDALYILRT